MYIEQQNPTCAPCIRHFREHVQTETWEGQNSAVKSCETTDKQFCFVFYLKFAAHPLFLLYLGTAQACDANKKLTIYLSEQYFFFFLLHKIKCRYQSHVSLAVWELISLNPKLHPRQLAGLLKMTHSLTVPCQWLCLSEIPQPCLRTAKVISIILFLTNSSHPSLNLIGLWSSCKTKTANLSVCVFEQCLPSNTSRAFELVFSEVWKTWQSHFRCSDVTQSFWLKSSLNMRFGLLWCGVSSDAILACYLPLLFSVTHSCKDWHGSCQSWDSVFYSWWLQIKDTGKVNSGSTMTSRTCKLLPVFTPARETILQKLESRF